MERSLTHTDVDPMFEEADGLISDGLSKLVGRSWEAWDNASGAGVSVEGSMPILYFGDLIEYQNSPVRVVTVGLNPSGEEFPFGDRRARFPGAASALRNDPYRHCVDLNSYFERCPYRWFNDYQKILRGFGVSYAPDATSTALHTDICSPVATAPTWSHLDGDTKHRLLGDGVPIWHDLIRFLRPHVIVMSVAREHLARIDFAVVRDWEVLHRVADKSDGEPRRWPYAVKARWHEVEGQPALLVFGAPAQTPFGSISDQDKQRVGETIKTYYDLTSSTITVSELPDAGPGGPSRGS